jgi:hypothetical protein
VIDPNRERGIINERLKVNRKIGIELRKEYSSMYSMDWEMKRTSSILEGIISSENIWYLNNRDYGTVICLKTILYNIRIMSNRGR